MATTATLNPTNLLFVNGGNQESKITTGSGFFRFDGASAAAAVTLRNIGNASAADHAVNKSQLDSSVTAATAARVTTGDGAAGGETGSPNVSDSLAPRGRAIVASTRSHGDTGAVFLFVFLLQAFEQIICVNFF